MSADRRLGREVLTGAIDAGEAAAAPSAGSVGGGGSDQAGEHLLRLGLNALARAHEFDYFALRLMPDAATPQCIEGICRMIRSFTPWHDVEPDPDVNPPAFADAAAAARFVLREAHDAIDRFAGFGQGYTGHMLTFGQALVELATMGDVEWAESCRLAFRKYVTVTRRGPDADSKPRPEHAPSDLRPTDSAYWERRGDHSVDIGHVFKYPYSYYNLLRRAGDPELARLWEGKAYRLF